MPAAGILGWKRSKYWKPILHSSKSPESPRKSFLELLRIVERRKYQRGPTPWLGGWGCAPPTGRAPHPPGPPGGPPVPIFCYMKSFTLEKIISKLAGRNSAATRRNQSRAPVEQICRGNFPPGGGNHHHHHHQRSSHWEGVNLH